MRIGDSMLAISNCCSCSACSLFMLPSSALETNQAIKKQRNVVFENESSKSKAVVRSGDLIILEQKSVTEEEEEEEVVVAKANRV